MRNESNRKTEEKEFHDALRGDPERQSRASNNKFYSVTRGNLGHVESWLGKHCQGATALDYGCGEGELSVMMARAGAQVFSIDISTVSLRNATGFVEQHGYSGKILFAAMDAESLGFADDTFDVIHISGVLHHVDVNIAFPELRRVLKPGGRVIASEGLGHNPLIQLYRKMTPHLRTEWEAQHIIKKEQMQLAGEYFGEVNYRFFHLATLAFVPIRNVPVLGPLALTCLEVLDRFLLRIPLLRWQAWIIVMELSQPLKTAEIQDDSANG